MENVGMQDQGTDLARCEELLYELCESAAEIISALDNIRSVLSEKCSVVNINADGLGVDELLRSNIGAIL